MATALITTKILHVNVSLVKGKKKTIKLNLDVCCFFDFYNLIFSEKGSFGGGKGCTGAHWPVYDV